MQEIIGTFTKSYDSVRLNERYALFRNDWTISDEDNIYRELLISGNLRLKETEKPYEEQLTRWNDENTFFTLKVPSLRIKGPKYNSIINVRTVNSEEHSIGLIDFLTQGGFREVFRLFQKIKPLIVKYGIPVF